MATRREVVELEQRLEAAMEMKLDAWNRYEHALEKLEETVDKVHRTNDRLDHACNRVKGLQEKIQVIKDYSASIIRRKKLYLSKVVGEVARRDEAAAEQRERAAAEAAAQEKAARAAAAENEHKPRNRRKRGRSKSKRRDGSRGSSRGSTPVRDIRNQQSDHAPAERQPRKLHAQSEFDVLSCKKALGHASRYSSAAASRATNYKPVRPVQAFHDRRSTTADGANDRQQVKNSSPSNEGKSKPAPGSTISKNSLSSEKQRSSELKPDPSIMHSSPALSIKSDSSTDMDSRASTPMSYGSMSSLSELRSDASSNFGVQSIEKSETSLSASNYNSSKSPQNGMSVDVVLPNSGSLRETKMDRTRIYIDELGERLARVQQKRAKAENSICYLQMEMSRLGSDLLKNRPSVDDEEANSSKD